VVLTVGVLWIGSVVVLWPVLGANNLGLASGLATVATVFGFLISYTSYGLALILVYRLITNRQPVRQSAPVGQPIGRRAFLAGGAGLALVLASGNGVRRIYNGSTLPYDGMQYRGAGIKPITPNDEFYVVTKNIIDPNPKKAAWRLRIDGAVESPRTYNFADLASMPSVEQEMTLECISNKTGAGLMSNAVWKGVPLRRLIEDASPDSGIVDVILHAADGYTHDVTFEKMMEETTLLAYEMNGEPLPNRHGYPARVLVPGYYGEGSVKWVTRIELFKRNVEDSYYGKQGWEPAHVSTTSRFDVERFAPQLPAKPGETVTLKGIAFAGDRGVDKVEVSTDGGGSYKEAKIDYSSSRLSWVFWSYNWRPEKSGEHELAVRATDGTGELQSNKVTSVNPDGASGYHRMTTRVEA
jgi:DMSO/TMAO reductase YedYZ molybdopterin-dependent catalytic subunit